MTSRPSDFICALAGVVLVVLVFLPWWQVDAAASPPRFAAAGWTAYAPLEVRAMSAWNGELGAAVVWLATGVLAAALVVVGPRRADSLVLLRPSVAAFALVSLVAAVIRLADPPAGDYAPAPAALFGVGLMAVIAVSAVAGLRRP